MRPKTTLLLAVWPRDAKRSDTPAKYVVRALTGKSWGMGVSAAACALATGGYLQWLLASCKNGFLVCYSLMGLVITSSVGCQRYVVWTHGSFKTGVVGVWSWKLGISS